MVTRALPDQPDLLERRVPRDRRAPKENVDQPDLLERRVHRVPKESKVPKENVDQPDPQVLLANRVPKENRAPWDLQAPEVHRALLEREAQPEEEFHQSRRPCLKSFWTY